MLFNCCWQLAIKQFGYSIVIVNANGLDILAVYNEQNGMAQLNTGMEYWNDL